MDKWTDNDEIKLRELQARKHEFFTTTRARLEEAVRNSASSLNINVVAMVDALMGNPKEFRDALEPLDDGVRCE